MTANPSGRAPDRVPDLDAAGNCPHVSAADATARGVGMHATCVAIGAAGVLITGASGVGKSDLALRLIDAGASLVADDRVELHDDGAIVRARAPAGLAGLLEVRGLGLVRLPFLAEAPVRLAVRLVAAAEIERLPDAERIALGIGQPVPALALWAFEPAAPAKLRLALASLAGTVERVEPRWQ